MKKFSHLIYYDLKHPLRNDHLISALKKYCDNLSVELVEDDYLPHGLNDVEIERCDALVTGVFDHYKSKLVKAARLRYVFMLATDTSDFDHSDFRERGVILQSGIGYSSESVAELSIAMMLFLARNLEANQDELKMGSEFGFEICKKHLAIIGAGRIGSAVARRAASLGMTVGYHSRSSKPELESQGIKKWQLIPLLAAADVLSVNLPLTTETRGFIDRRVLTQLKAGTMVICPSRAEIFVIEDLAIIGGKKKLKVWFDGVEDKAIVPRLQKAGCQIWHTPVAGARTRDAQERLMNLALSGIEAALAMGIAGKGDIIEAE